LPNFSQVGGADVVLNSLSSPGMVAASAALLSRGGRFVEVAKRDIWSPPALASVRPDATYSLLAMDFMSGAVLRTGLARLSAGLATGSVRPLHLVVHQLHSVQAALRQMSKARGQGWFPSLKPMGYIWSYLACK
jgi:Zinc-binding dehydrogenase